MSGQPGAMEVIKRYNDWDITLSIIVSLQPISGSNADLLLYSPQSRRGEFYRLSNTGNMTLLRRYTNWRSTWLQIVPVQNPPGLLFYSSIDHTAELYSYNTSSGQIQRLWKDTGWRSSWEQIVLFPYSNSRLLLYSSSEHTGQVIKVSQDGYNEVKNHNNFGTNLQIVPIRTAHAPVIGSILLYAPITHTAFIKTVAVNGDLTLFKQYTNFPYTQYSKVVLPGYPFNPGNTVFFYDPGIGGGGQGIADVQKIALLDHGEMTYLRRHPVANNWRFFAPISLVNKDCVLAYRPNGTTGRGEAVLLRVYG